MNSEENKKEMPKQVAVAVKAKSVSGGGAGGRHFGGQAHGGGAGGRERFKYGGKGGKDPRVKPEFDQRILNIRRVTRVSAGGKRFNFSVAIVIGNRKGSVGVGLGKGADTALAIDKAVRNAKKNMVNLKLTKTQSIPHQVYEKYSSARLFIQPSPGRGVVAGSALRFVIELAGIKDVTAKIVSPSKNKLNLARGAVKALSKFAV